MFHFVVFDNKYQLNKHLIVYQFDWFLKWNKKKEKEEKKNQIKIIINNNKNKKHKHTTTTAIFHNWTNFRSVSILFWFRKTTHLSPPLQSFKISIFIDWWQIYIFYLKSIYFCFCFKTKCLIYYNKSFYYL